MEDTFARLSKAGRVVCGKQHADGGFYCDEPLAGIVRVHEPPNYPERELVALPGWRPDRKGIWRQTTSEADRRRHGAGPTHRPKPLLPELPALACCPKCGVLQWLDAERLRVRPQSGGPSTPARRWAIRGWSD